MKEREGFVSNSSSTSFIITNISSRKKTLVDFVKENPELLDEFLEQYDWNKSNERYNQEQMLQDAAEREVTFKPHEALKLVFGDEQGTIIGNVYDYILRDGGTSKSFTWRFDEYYR